MKKIIFASLMIFMTLIAGALADSEQQIGYGSVTTVQVIISNATSNFSYVPSYANFTLDLNETMNFTFNLTSTTADPMNISFRSNSFTNFSGNYFNLVNETRNITAYLIPFNDSGDFNDTIQIIWNHGNSIELLGSIFVNFSVGQLPGGKFTFMKCSVDVNGLPQCVPVNMSEFANITVINQTTENVTTNEYFAVGRDFLNQLIQSMQNNTDIIQTSLNQRTSEYENTFILYNILNAKSGKLYYDISPTNELVNISGMNSDELSTAIGHLLEQGLITETKRSEDQQTVVGNGYLVRTVEITSIASVDRVKTQQDADNFNVTLIISAMVLFIAGIVVAIIILLRKRVF